MDFFVTGSGRQTPPGQRPLPSYLSSALGRKGARAGRASLAASEAPGAKDGGAQGAAQ